MSRKQKFCRYNGDAELCSVGVCVLAGQVQILSSSFFCAQQSAASAQAKSKWFLAQNQQSNRHVLLYIDLLSFFWFLFAFYFPQFSFVAPLSFYR